MEIIVIQSQSMLPVYSRIYSLNTIEYAAIEEIVVNSLTNFMIKSI